MPGLDGPRVGRDVRGQELAELGGLPAELVPGRLQERDFDADGEAGATRVGQPRREFINFSESRLSYRF